MTNIVSKKKLNCSFRGFQLLANSEGCKLKKSKDKENYTQ